jgi:hypothetical protein
MSYSALIFSHSITPRLQYIVDFLSHYYGLSFRLTSDEEKYLNSKETCKINYSYHRLQPDEIWIHSHVLLSESYVRQVKVECFEKNGYKAFFKAEGDFGFDLFAAVFYFLTRYEEYLPHHKDIYGRFAHEDSVAYKEKFLDEPLVNIWLEDFRHLLVAKNNEFSKPATGFSFMPTYDIDMAWSYKNKGFKRNAGGMVKLFFSGKWRSLANRARILRGKMQDPFDAYEWMDSVHYQYGLKPTYFILVAKECTKYDKNIDVMNVEFQSLIQNIASYYTVGLHPSWASGDLPALLTKEKQTLEQISNKTISDSRQHYIRLHLPTTYQRLLSLGITNDYSMGYGSINGFRASIATPYYWYDLKHEEKTQLIIYPFCFMDANSYYEQQFSPETAFDELMHYYNIIKSVNGTMITIWHNSFLGTDPEFEGWREVYERFVDTVSKS